MGRYYRVGEVATLTRVSVRTLHHYDRIGLLRPALHSAGATGCTGNRSCCAQQILTLRYLGFPLKRIGELLDRDDFNLVASLRVQRLALHDRIAELECISAVIGELVDQRLASGEWSWQLVIEASQVVAAGLTRGEETMDAYYTSEQMTRFEEARQATQRKRSTPSSEAGPRSWPRFAPPALSISIQPAPKQRHWPIAGSSSASGRCGTSPTTCGMPSRPTMTGARSRDTIGRRKRLTSRSSHGLRPPAEVPAGTPVRISADDAACLTGSGRRSAVDCVEEANRLLSDVVRAIRPV